MSILFPKLWIYAVPPKIEAALDAEALELTRGVSTADPPKMPTPQGLATNQNSKM